MSDLIVYDSKIQQKRTYVPPDPKNIGIYVCGITVYDFCHIGHARAFIAFDVIVRYLKYKFGKDNVRFVRNITDIDDKIIKRAQENNELWTDLTTRFIDAMHEDERNLGLLPPDYEPRATQYMPQMIKLVQKLIANGHAYAAGNGDVYYRVRSFAHYGSLAKRNLDDLAVGARVEVNEAKDDPLDFVLWKAAKPGEPQWASPWGPGRPGWHLECSAMSMDLLGETFDFHGGGFDLLFPHHENECAQSQAASGQEFVRNWLHVGFLQISKEKMSKSLNNFITIKDLLNQVDNSEQIRFFMISGHYRSPLEYSLEQIQLCKNALDRLYKTKELLQLLDLKNANAAVDTEYEKRFYDAMNDDFNTSEAIAVLFELSNYINKAIKYVHLHNRTELVFNKDDLSLGLLYLKLAGILGLLQQDASVYFRTKEFGEDLEQLIKIRNHARENKNWPLADEARELSEIFGLRFEDKSIVSEHGIRMQSTSTYLDVKIRDEAMSNPNKCRMLKDFLSKNLSSTNIIN